MEGIGSKDKDGRIRVINGRGYGYRDGYSVVLG
jgi:hypothetical protein